MRYKKRVYIYIWGFHFWYNGEILHSVCFKSSQLKKTYLKVRWVVVPWCLGAARALSWACIYEGLKVEEIQTMPGKESAWGVPQSPRGDGRVSLENGDLTRENGDLSRENEDLMGYNWKIRENSQLKRNGYFFDLPRIIPRWTVNQTPCQYEIIWNPQLNGRICLNKGKLASDILDLQFVVSLCDPKHSDSSRWSYTELMVDQCGISYKTQGYYIILMLQITGGPLHKDYSWQLTNLQDTLGVPKNRT